LKTIPLWKFKVSRIPLNTKALYILKSMELREIQMKLKEMYYEKDRGRGLFATFTWLVEEVGELAQAILEGKYGNVEEEIADVIAWTISIANLTGVDVMEALRRKYFNGTQ
jgi:NTP pyrophosphatase (non-canonical NTP hydrolase)